MKYEITIIRRETEKVYENITTYFFEDKKLLWLYGKTTTIIPLLDDIEEIIISKN